MSFPHQPLSVGRDNVSSLILHLTKISLALLSRRAHSRVLHSEEQNPDTAAAYRESRHQYRSQRSNVANVFGFIGHRLRARLPDGTRSAIKRADYAGRDETSCIWNPNIETLARPAGVKIKAKRKRKGKVHSRSSARPSVRLPIANRRSARASSYSNIFREASRAITNSD